MIKSQTFLLDQFTLKLYNDKKTANIIESKDDYT